MSVLHADHQENLAHAHEAKQLVQTRKMVQWQHQQFMLQPGLELGHKACV